MNRILILFAVSLFVLLYSCGDNAQSSPPIEDASLYLTVQDASDGSLLAEAKATFGAVEGITDSEGLATFKLQAGSRVLLVEKENYATERRVVSTSDVASGSVSIVSDIYQNVRLYKTNAGLEGLLYYKDSKGQSLPMPNVPIRIDISGSNLATTSYSCDKTNSKGEYKCSNLPAIAGSGYSVSIYALGLAINGVNYSTVKIDANVPLLPGVVANNGRTDHEASDIAFTIMENPRIVEYANKSLPLTIKFSEAVDISQFQNSWVEATQAINIEWKDCASNACTQLKLTPIPEWINGTTVILKDIKSISNKTISLYYLNIDVLDIDLSLEKVAGIKMESISKIKKDTIEYTSTKAKITWKKLAGATKYNVLVKTSDTTDFGIVAEGIPDTTTEISINGGNPIGGKTNKVVVQAFNRSGKSLFSDPADIKAAPDDGKVPTYAPRGLSILDPCTGNNCQPGYLSSYCELVADAQGVVDFCEISTYRGIYSFWSYDADNFASVHNLMSILNNPKAFDKDKIQGSGITETAIALGRVFFSKPMNTSVPLIVQCTPEDNAACKKLKLTPKWNNDQNLNLTVTTVKENTVNHTVNIIYSIGGLKGLNGKDFVANPTAPTNAQINSVKIEFSTLNVCAAIPVYPCKGYCETSTGKGDYGHCLTEACTNNPANPLCVGKGYCETDMGKGDPTNCPTEYCNINGWNDFPHCPTQYCNISNHWNEYDKCPDKYCAYDNNLPDYSNCPTQSCIKDNNHNPVCGEAYCNIYGPTDPDNCRPQYCAFGMNISRPEFFGYCPAEFCNVNRGDTRCKNNTTYCASEPAKTDYDNCLTEACGNNAANPLCVGKGYCDTQTGKDDFGICHDSTYCDRHPEDTENCPTDPGP